jgi:uncharacterized protein with HEPN domain
VGEALNVFRNRSPELADQIHALHEIVGFRNVLIHGYSLVDHEIVWRVVQDHLPTLVQDVTSLLARLGEDE